MSPPHICLFNRVGLSVVLLYLEVVKRPREEKDSTVGIRFSGFLSSECWPSGSVQHVFPCPVPCTHTRTRVRTPDILSSFSTLSWWQKLDFANMKTQTQKNKIAIPHGTRNYDIGELEFVLPLWLFS